MRLRASTAQSVAILAVLLAGPALAHDHAHMPPPASGYQDDAGPYRGSAPSGWQNRDGDYGAQRDRWLADCHHRLGDNGVGGAVIGGLVGGIAGHEIAGRHDRVLGTVAGAAVGAIAGAAIDKAEDRSRVRDRCEQMLEGYGAQGYAVPGYSYSQGGAYGYPAPGYSYGYAPMVMMVPMVMQQVPVQQATPCKETVTTREYVTYETVRRRYIPRRPIVHDKRVRIIPDKRVNITPDKRINTQ